MTLRLALALLFLSAGCVDFSTLTRDYGKDAGSGGPCPSFAFFCEGFEDGLGAWASDPQATSYITTAVESGVSHSGASALVSKVDPPDGAGGGSANAILHLFTPVTSGTLAIRAWWMSPGTVGQYATSLRLSPDGGTIANFVGYQVGLEDANQWFVQRDPLMTGRDHATALHPDAGVWDCIELVIDLPDAGSSGHVTLYVNGQVGTSFDDPTLDSVLTQYGGLSVGVIDARDNVDETRYVDDVALATQRIGCD